MKAYIVERAALVRNIQSIVAEAGETPVWGVLKGNGYGIGALPFARLLWDNGVERFAVTELREAEQLRGAFPDAPILMLRATNDPEEINALLDLRVILTIGSAAMAEAVDRAAQERADVAEVHLCVDTGMGRYGFLPTELEQILSVYRAQKHLAVSGIFTHFHSAFCSEKATRQQFEQFTALVERIRNAGYETGMVHCCNSAAFLRHPEMRLDAVRIGSAFLGRVGVSHGLKLQRIGYLECTVEELRTLPTGHTVGYGAGFRCKQPTRIAVICVGWANGFAPPRENDLHRLRDRLRDLFHSLIGLLRPKNILVSVEGQNCRTLGHIGMVHAVVDVTGVECALGSRVTIEMSPLHLRGVKIHYR